MSAVLRCGDKTIDLSRPVVMGILNVTPDSFSDGGLFVDVDEALRRAEAMVAEGAAVIDVGGESTRPGAQAVTADEEIRRVVPVIEALAARCPVPISVDTSKAAVMRAAVAAGAGLINDVWALRADGALKAAADLAVPVCLMHMQGEPRTMQKSPQYRDVVTEVGDFLAARVAAARASGIETARILVDPGFGFGKSVAHNLALLRQLSDLRSRLAVPIVVGLSRKSLIGPLLGLPVEERAGASVALALMALREGATMVRVHDVKATVEAARLFQAVYAL